MEIEGGFSIFEVRFLIGGGGFDAVKLGGFRLGWSDMNGEKLLSVVADCCPMRRDGGIGRDFWCVEGP
jgi:hypothetical protein